MLRPGGQLIFLVNSVHIVLTWPDQDDQPATETLQRPAFVRFRAAGVVRRGSLGSLPGGPRARARLPDVTGVAAARPAMLPARSATR